MNTIDFISQVMDGTGISTDDTFISRRFIYNEFQMVRAELLKQELNKDRLLDGSFAQTISGFKVRESDISQTNRYNTKKVLVSEYHIPRLIEYDKGIALFQIFTMGGMPIVLTDKTTFENKTNRRHQPPHVIYGFVDKNRLVISGIDDLEEMELDIVGFFYDPVEASALSLKSNCVDDSEKCKPAYEMDINLPGHIARRAVEMVREPVFRVLGIPLDNTNNSQSDIQIQQPSTNR